MNVLDVFAGSRSIGKVAQLRGHRVFSIDWEDYEGIDLVKDVEFLQTSDIPFIPDYIHLSPDCRTYSVAAFSFHRDFITPRSEDAVKSDRVISHCVKLLKEFEVLNPDVVYTMENPRGMLRRMPFMVDLPRVTVWYCKYGDTRAKPTDIWSNMIRSIFCPDGWQPRAGCFNSNTKCHHEKSPRGVSSGTQNLADAYERSIIPEQLCVELIEQAEKFYQRKMLTTGGNV